MNITKVTFPLYKLRSYIEIDRSPLGLIKVTSIKGTYIIDDLSLKGTFIERRLKLKLLYSKEEIYALKERVIYLRQLFKYKTGSTFIDFNGNIIKYKKSSKLFDVKSYKIEKTKEMEKATVLYLNKLDIPFMVYDRLTNNTKYASVMDTDWGIFLYDITSRYHEPYKRKI